MPGYVCCSEVHGFDSDLALQCWPSMVRVSIVVTNPLSEVKVQPGFVLTGNFWCFTS